MYSYQIFFSFTRFSPPDFPTYMHQIKFLQLHVDFPSHTVFSYILQISLFLLDFLLLLQHNFIPKIRFYFCIILSMLLYQKNSGQIKKRLKDIIILNSDKNTCICIRYGFYLSQLVAINEFQFFIKSFKGYLVCKRRLL